MLVKSYGFFFSLLGVLIGSACVLSGPAVLGPIAPRPRVNIEPRQESIGLELSEAIKDAFVVPKDDVYTSDMQVSSWRASLEIAFENGLSSSFAASQGQPDLVLKLAKTEIFFDDKDSRSAIVVAGTATGRVSRIQVACNIQYHAQLLDSTGNVLASDLGAVRYLSDTTRRQDLVVGAVAQMFEQIAQRFFVERKVGPSPSR